MQQIKREISKELYDNYASRSAADWKAEIRENLPESWVCGYGYYGTDLMIINGKYYLVHTIGDSCD